MFFLNIGMVILDKVPKLVCGMSYQLQAVFLHPKWVSAYQFNNRFCRKNMLPRHKLVPTELHNSDSMSVLDLEMLWVRRYSSHIRTCWILNSCSKPKDQIPPPKNCFHSSIFKKQQHFFSVCWIPSSDVFSNKKKTWSFIARSLVESLEVQRALRYLARKRWYVPKGACS